MIQHLSIGTRAIRSFTAATRQCATLRRKMREHIKAQGLRVAGVPALPASQSDGEWATVGGMRQGIQYSVHDGFLVRVDVLVEERSAPEAAA